jgi:hypothetical protein
MLFYAKPAADSGCDRICELAKFVLAAGAVLLKIDRVENRK